MPTCERGRPVSTVPESGCCKPITARNRLDLRETDGPPPQAHEAAILDGEACSLEDRFSAVRDRQIANAQRQPPAIEVSYSPAIFTPGLMSPPAMRLCSTRLPA